MRPAPPAGGAPVASAEGAATYGIDGIICEVVFATQNVEGPGFITGVSPAAGASLNFDIFLGAASSSASTCKIRLQRFFNRSHRVSLP